MRDTLNTLWVCGNNSYYSQSFIQEHRTNKRSKESFNLWTNRNLKLIEKLPYMGWYELKAQHTEYSTHWIHFHIWTSRSLKLKDSDKLPYMSYNALQCAKFFEWADFPKKRRAKCPSIPRVLYSTSDITRTCSLYEPLQTVRTTVTMFICRNH